MFVILLSEKFFDFVYNPLKREKTEVTVKNLLHLCIPMILDFLINAQNPP